MKYLKYGNYLKMLLKLKYYNIETYSENGEKYTINPNGYINVDGNVVKNVFGYKNI